MLFCILCNAWNLKSSSVHFSHSVMSDSLWPHGLQHAWLPYPSPIARACSDSCPSSWWCHPTIWSSVNCFSSCLQSFPASVSIPMSHFFSSGGLSSGVSASTSVLPVNTQDWSPLGWTGWTGSPRDSQESSPTKQFKSINSLSLSLLYGPTLFMVHPSLYQCLLKLMSIELVMPSKNKNNNPLYWILHRIFFLNTNREPNISKSINER